MKKSLIAAIQGASLLAINPLLLITISSTSAAPTHNIRTPPASNTTSLPDFLAKEANRHLQQEKDGQDLGQRCGRNTACREGLECSNDASSGIGGIVFARRCMPPKECLQERLSDFEQTYGDFEDYKTLVLNDAGTSQYELIDLIRQATQRGGNFSAASLPFQSVVDSIHKNMVEPMQGLRTIMKDCGVSSPSSPSSTAASNSTLSSGKIQPRSYDNVAEPRSPTETGVPPVDMTGFHIEGGFLLQGSFSYIEAWTPSTNYRDSYFRWCIGLELGGGADFSFLFAQYPSGTDIQIVNGGSLYQGIDVGMVLHFSAGGGVDFQGFGYFELGFGLGVGASVGGSVCIAYKSDWEGVPPFPLPFPTQDDP